MTAPDLLAREASARSSARRRRTRENGRDARAWLVSGVLAALALALYLGPVRRLDGVDAPFELPWWALAAGFCLADVFMVHVHFRRNAHSLTLAEIPLVVGLFFASPASLVVGRLVGASIALALGRRQRPVKLGFNVALFTLEAGLAALVFHRLASADDALAPKAVLAAFVAVIAITLCGVVAVASAISLTEMRPRLRKFAETLALDTAVTVANTSLGLIGVAILWSAPPLGVLLLPPAAALVLAYRAYLQERKKHGSLEFLYETTRVIHRSQELEPALEALLSQARKVFRADLAEIVLFPARGETALRTTLGPGDRVQLMEPIDRRSAARTAETGEGAVLLSRQPRPATEGLGPREHEVIDAMISPLEGESRVVGTLLVANRLGDLSSFDAEDFRLFQTLANHAGVSLEVIELGEELRHHAFYDSLTELPNRALFRDRVEHALAARGGGEERAAVLFLDLNDFKTINDSLGHAAGDDVLVAVANRLRSCLRPADSPARLGGDEFAVLIENVRGTSEIAALAERIVHALAAPVVVEGKEVSVAASIGIALSASDGGDADALLRDADAAMYRAKGAGKGSYQIFEPSMHSAALRRLELKAALQAALEQREFLLHYQPIVELETSRITGFEALVRWAHPERGLVSPADFVPLAEETGYIVPIGRWVLEEACREAAAWRDRFSTTTPLTVNLNISARQLQEADFVGDVASALRTSELDPEHLVLELTETVLMQHQDGVVDTLDELRQLGVGLAIDDFGTGYSSLSYLARFPVDTLKIAKPFVDEAARSRQHAALARAVVTIGDSLGLRTVAEGIERPEQRDTLRDLGCELGQGFLFSRPLPAEDVEAVLTAGAVDELSSGIQADEARVIRFSKPNTRTGLRRVIG